MECKTPVGIASAGSLAARKAQRLMSNGKQSKAITLHHSIASTLFHHLFAVYFFHMQRTDMKKQFLSTGTRAGSSKANIAKQSRFRRPADWPLKSEVAESAAVMC